MQVALNFNETAALIGITRLTLERWLAAKKFMRPIQENAHGHRFFALTDVDEWLAKHPEYAERSKLSNSACAELIATATKRTQDQRAVRKAERQREAAKAAREEARAAKLRAPIAPEPATADAEQADAAPVDELTRLAHAPRRQGRHTRRLMVPPDADAMTNADIDRRLGIGAMPKLRWHL